MWYANRPHQQVHCEQAWSTVHENSFCYSRVTQWFMKCQTLLPLKNSGLHICLSCLFQLSWWHTVPPSPGMAVWTLWQMTGELFPPKKGNKAMNEKSGENGKMTPCALSLTGLHLSTPHGAHAVLRVQRGREAFLHRCFSSGGLRTKMF